jgi:hypothetical protein
MVNLHRNRYAVPEELIGRRVEIRESIDSVRIFEHAGLVATHPRLEPGAGLRSITPGQRTPRRRRTATREISREERELRAAGPELDRYVTALSDKLGSSTTRALRRLHRIYLDYPDKPLRQAVRRAAEYGLFDLARLERLILREVAGDIFRLRTPSEDDHAHDR